MVRLIPPYMGAPTSEPRVFGEVHARAMPDVCRVTEGDHWLTDDCHERAHRRIIEQCECDEYADPSTCDQRKVNVPARDGADVSSSGLSVVVIASGMPVWAIVKGARRDSK